MAENGGRSPWLSLRGRPEGPTSEKQEAAIRGYAEALGYETLRGFWKVLEKWDWDYYDVLHEVSP